MYFDFYDYFPEMQTAPAASNTYIIIAAAIGVLLGLILFFTFLKKSNEAKVKGKKKAIYNFLNLNKFYTEDIVRALNILTFFVATAVGLAMIFKGKWQEGILVLVGVNVLARIVYELLMMYVIQVRKTLAIERKVDRIEKFYEDDFEDYDDGECSSCENFEESSCENCTESSCEGCSSFTTQENFTYDKPKDPPHVIEL